MESDAKTKVMIFTNHYRITGEIALIPGARLTDYIVDAKTFLAVSQAEVLDRKGHRVFTTPFLNVHRDHIEIIVPLDMVHAE